MAKITQIKRKVTIKKTKAKKTGGKTKSANRRKRA